jgi:hypothetical protein
MKIYKEARTKEQQQHTPVEQTTTTRRQQPQRQIGKNEQDFFSLHSTIGATYTLSGVIL